MSLAEKCSENLPHSIMLRRHEKSRRSTCCCSGTHSATVYAAFGIVLLLLMLLLLLVIGTAATVLAAWKYQKLPEQKPYIAAILDAKHVAHCAHTLTHMRDVPCRMENTLITADTALSPLRCYDDAFVVSGGTDNCKETPFQLTDDASGVTVPQDGVYRVNAVITFFDSLGHHVTVSIRIDSDGASHSWLTCITHTVKGEVRNFSVCTIDGIRSFSAGDVIRIHLHQAFRGVSMHRKSTHMFVHML